MPNQNRRDFFKTSLALGVTVSGLASGKLKEIGRASCRERV